MTDLFVFGLTMLLKITALWFLVTALLFWKRPPIYPRRNPRTRFACLIPARNEEAVIGDLGNPRLLCRTIVEANRHAECDSYASSEDASFVEVEDEKFSLANFGTKLLKLYTNLPATAHKIVRTVLMILGLFLAFQVAKVVFPVLLFIWLIWIVFSLFRNLGN